jgi:hypothetical protein
VHKTIQIKWQQQHRLDTDGRTRDGVGNLKKEPKPISGHGGDPMLRRNTSLVVVAFLGFSFAALWWLTLPAAAKPAKAGPKGVDLYGDLLPPGAVARLGTVRLRIPYFNSALVFSKDG